MHVVARKPSKQTSSPFPLTSRASLQSIPQLFLQFPQSTSIKSTSSKSTPVNQFPSKPVLFPKGISSSHCFPKFPYKTPKLHKPIMKNIPFFLSSPYSCSPFPIPPLLVAAKP